MPLLTGGSGLYVQAVLDELRFPGTDPAIRGRLEAELEQEGPSEMHRRLQRVDAPAAAQILPTNGRRIVPRSGGQRNDRRAFHRHAGSNAPVAVFGEDRLGSRVEPVDQAITQRVHDMWRAGFVAEVESLRPGIDQGRTASRAVGYRQILDALDIGDDPDTAREPTIAATRRLARRQRSWFRRDRSVRWVESPSQISQILGTLGL